MRYTLTSRCRGCHASAAGFLPVLAMEPMPLAGMFCRTVAEAEEAAVFPLTWVRCTGCGAVQVAEDIPDGHLFGEYNYASSTVPGLVRHFAGFVDELAGFHGTDRPLTYLEIGCNDGVLLRRLPSAWRRVGVDPSDVARRGAEAGDWELINLPFTPEVVRAHGLEGRVDAMSGSNCLAHISDLREVFAGAALALKPGGHLWVEVHDLAATLRGGQWDTIYHEHKLEWSEPALVRCLARLGFVHEATRRLPLHGGLLRARFRREAGPQPMPEGAGDPEPGLTDLRVAYARRAETPAARELSRLLESGRRISAYGAAGRANVYLNQMRHLRFAHIVDEAPLRAGKFIPRTATPIVRPEALVELPSAACLITAWNYREDIIRKNPAHAGMWLTAFEDV